MITYTGSQPQEIINDIVRCVDREANDLPTGDGRRTRRQAKREEQARMAAEAILKWHKEKYVPVYGAMYVQDNDETDKELRGVVAAAFGLWPILSFLLPWAAKLVIQLMKKYLSNYQSTVYRYSHFGNSE